MLFNILYYDISIVSLFLLYGILIIFLLLQLKKKEKTARPFITSLIIYYLLDSIGNFFLYTYNRTTNFEKKIIVSLEQAEIFYYLSWMGTILILISPMCLIFILERSLFNKKILKKYHIVTISQIFFLTFFSIFIVMAFLTFAYMPIGERNQPIIIMVYPFIAGMILVQVLFYIAGFLYLSIKSTGEYRLNAFIVVVGIIWQLVVNAFSSFLSGEIRFNRFPYSMDVFYTFVSIFIFLRIIGLAIMTYGLIKLYYTKKD
jgi:hypothetical protein